MTTLAMSPLADLAAKAGEACGLMRNLSNQQRLLILCHLSSTPEMSVGALVARMDLSQSALSQHLARLRADGLVEYRRDAQTLYYRVSDPKVDRMLATLRDLFCPKL